MNQTPALFSGISGVLYGMDYCCRLLALSGCHSSLECSGALMPTMVPTAGIEAYVLQASTTTTAVACVFEPACSSKTELHASNGCYAVHMCLGKSQ